MINPHPLVGHLKTSDQKVKQYSLFPADCFKSSCLLHANVSGSVMWLPICIAKLSRYRYRTNQTAWLKRLLNHLQWSIWFIVIRQTKHDSNAVYYFHDPTNVGCLFLSLLPQILPISTLSRRRVNKTSWSNPRQTQICYIFQIRVIKALLKQNYLYLLSHSHIRIITLTCHDNIDVILQVCKNSSAKIMYACKITQIRVMRGQYHFYWNLCSLLVCSWVPQLNLRHLHCRGSLLFKSRQ